jgi:hypothetical protein
MTESCIKAGPNGTAVIELWLSAIGAPLLVVSVGRLVIRSFLCTTGNGSGCRTALLFHHGLVTGPRLRNPGM